MRYTDLLTTINTAINKALSNTHTSLIAKVEKVNDKTIDCKPVINRVVNGESIELPAFAEVPLIHMQGGSSSIVMPVAVGDYVKLIVNERCFDDWYVGLDNKEPRFSRMHDYSDCFAISGINPQSTEISLPIDGKIHIKGDVSHSGSLEVSNTITADKVVANRIEVNTLIINGRDYSTHTHTNGNNGANTGTPI